MGIFVKKIGLWHKINNYELKKRGIRKFQKKNEVLFFKYLSKLGYFIKSKSSLNKAMLVKSFQRHFRQK